MVTHHSSGTAVGRVGPGWPVFSAFYLFLVLVLFSVLMAVVVSRVPGTQVWLLSFIKRWGGTSPTRGGGKSPEASEGPLAGGLRQQEQGIEFI